MTKRERIAAYARADVAIALVAGEHSRANVGHDVIIWPGLSADGAVIDYGTAPGPGWACSVCDSDIYPKDGAR